MSTLATSASTLNDHTFPQLLILAEIAHDASAMAAVVFKEPEGRQVVSRLEDALLVTLDSELAAVADAARGQAG